MPTPPTEPADRGDGRVLRRLLEHLPEAPTTVGWVEVGAAGTGAEVAQPGTAGGGPAARAGDGWATGLAARLEASGYELVPVPVSAATSEPAPGALTAESDDGTDGGAEAASDGFEILLLGSPDDLVDEHGFRSLAELFARLRRHLVTGGRLLVLVAPPPPETGASNGATSTPSESPGALSEARRRSARNRTRALYEAGFAILDEVDEHPPADDDPDGGAAPKAAPEGPRLVGDGDVGLGAGGPHLTVARRAEHRVRSYRPGDEAAILDLFQQAFHQRRSPAQWRWRYADDPYGAHRISLAVDGEGTPLAHYAGYPVRMWAASGVLGGSPGAAGAADAPSAPGRLLDALQVGDTMTSPAARRVGRGRTSLLTRTVAHFYATFCRGRVDFNFGANVGKIQRFSRRTAGARRLEDVPYRSRPLDGAPFPGTPAGLGARLAGWRVERIAALPEPATADRGAGHRLAVERVAGEMDDLWRRSRGAYRLLVERDHRYLAWRYAAPDSAYHLWGVWRRRRLVGWSVFRHETRAPDGSADERLVWGDALFDPDEPAAPAALLTAATTAPELAGARRVEGWLGERPGWWGERVAGLGFERLPEPEDLGFVYVPFRVDPGEAFARDLYYTKADTDLF